MSESLDTSDGHLEVSTDDDGRVHQQNRETSALSGKDYVDRLPHEVLVFVFVLVPEPDKRGVQHVPDDLPKVFNLRLVCQLWYYLCEITPQLWRSIIERNFMHAEWVKLALDRTRGQKLNLERLDETSTLSPAISGAWKRTFPLLYEGVLRQGRAREITGDDNWITPPGAVQPDWTSIIRSMRANELEVFELTLITPVNLNFGAVLDEGAFSGAIPPKLWSFSIQGGLILPSSTVLLARSLTHLSLKYCRFGCTIRELFCLIGEMSLLSELELSTGEYDDRTLVDDNDHGSPRDPVTLPNLLKLKLSMSLRCIEAVYDTVDIPDRCRVSDAISIRVGTPVSTVTAALDRMYAKHLLTVFSVSGGVDETKVSISFDTGDPPCPAMLLSIQSLTTQEKRFSLLLIPGSHVHDHSDMKSVCLHAAEAWPAFKHATVLSGELLPKGIWKDTLALLPSIKAIEALQSLSDLEDALLGVSDNAYPRHLQGIFVHEIERTKSLFDGLLRGLDRTPVPRNLEEQYRIVCDWSVSLENL
ncbi:unnamed protein product [Peniophora sp. CBMAI 1063]|nr:unnamed protein product [Peniophora sp. CBMAI 1063]